LTKSHLLQNPYEFPSSLLETNIPYNSYLDINYNSNFEFNNQKGNSTIISCVAFQSII